MILVTINMACTVGNPPLLECSLPCNKVHIRSTKSPLNIKVPVVQKLWIAKNGIVLLQQL